jgi:outer membrane protein assembly factor BamA
VDVLKRSRSIDLPDDVLVVIMVEEQPGASPDLPQPGWLARTRADLLWVPVLTFNEAFGASYGVRVAAVDLAGRGNRLSAPLVWGGERRAGVEFEQTFAHGPVSRASASLDVTRTEHPAFDVPERRTGGRVRIERAITPSLALHAGAEASNVRFGSVRDRVERIIGGLKVDTRADPAVPRNALWGTVQIERVHVDIATRRRHTLDVNAAVGLFSGSSLSARVFQVSASGALPEYEQTWIGGAATLRGYRAGYRVDDNAAGASVAWTRPFGSPMAVARTGLRVFVDWAAVYGAGTSWRDGSYDRGVGGGAFATIGSFTVGLDVARGRDKTRVHFRAGTRF